MDQFVGTGPGQGLRYEPAGEHRRGRRNLDEPRPVTSFGHFIRDCRDDRPEFAGRLGDDYRDLAGVFGNEQQLDAIPVPLGSLTWGFNADAFNTLLNGTALVMTTANSTGWVLATCCAPSSPDGSTIVATQPNGVGSYPQWSQVSKNVSNNQ